MPTPRKLLIGVGATAAVATLTLATSVTGLASATGSAARRGPDVPAWNAPHVGHVSGAQYGPHISMNNPRSVHAFKVLHQQMLGSAVHLTKTKAQPNTIHEYVGTSFNQSTVGSQATQSVSTKIDAGPSTPALYTPTMYPSGGSTPGSCIEVSTAYLPGGSNNVAAWDWCQAITFVAQVPINRAFIRTYTQHHNYSVQIVQTDAATNTWTAYLYNYKTMQWQTFYSQKGTSQVGLVEGWDIYELYSELKGDGQSYACDDLFGKRIEARGIRVGVGGRLVIADPTHASNDYDVPLSQFHCSSLSYSMIKQFSHWKAIG